MCASRSVRSSTAASSSWAAPTSWQADRLEERFELTPPATQALLLLDVGFLATRGRVGRELQGVAVLTATQGHSDGLDERPEGHQDEGQRQEAADHVAHHQPGQPADQEEPDGHGEPERRARRRRGAPVSHGSLAGPEVGLQLGQLVAQGGDPIHRRTQRAERRGGGHLARQSVGLCDELGGLA